jgi:hypothetical protein
MGIRKEILLAYYITKKPINYSNNLKETSRKKDSTIFSYSPNYTNQYNALRITEVCTFPSSRPKSVQWPPHHRIQHNAFLTTEVSKMPSSWQNLIECPLHYWRKSNALVSSEVSVMPSSRLNLIQFPPHQWG